jgi:hypothetical protein
MAEALTIARQLGFQQPVKVFGVQPFDIRPRTGLSAPMAQRLDALQQALRETVADLCRAAVPA